MFSLQTWLLPSAPFSYSITSFQLLSSHVSCDFRSEEYFNAWGNWHRVERDTVDKAQKAAVYAVHLCSRKPVVQRFHLLSTHRPEHRVCKSCVAHPVCRVPNPIPIFLQHLFSYGLAVALKTLWNLNFHLNFITLLPFLPCHYSYDKAEKPRQKVFEPPFPLRLSICFQGTLLFSKHFPDTLNVLGIN